MTWPLERGHFVLAINVMLCSQDYFLACQIAISFPSHIRFKALFGIGNHYSRNIKSAKIIVDLVGFFFKYLARTTCTRPTVTCFQRQILENMKMYQHHSYFAWFGGKTSSRKREQNSTQKIMNLYI